MVKAGCTTRAGFTLVEILCVVVIVGIAAAVVVPQISSRDDLKAAASARVLMADLIYAQNRAITLQQAQYIRFDGTNQEYRLLTGPGITMIQHPVNKTDYVVRFGESGSGSMRETRLLATRFVGMSGNVQLALAFDELGTPLACNLADNSTETLRSGYIQIQCGTQKLQINVEPYTGQISVENIP